MADANADTVSDRFNDDERITRALRRAAEFARLRREMWDRFRASIEAEEAARTSVASNGKRADEAPGDGRD